MTRRKIMEACQCCIMKKKDECPTECPCYDEYLTIASCEENLIRQIFIAFLPYGKSLDIECEECKYRKPMRRGGYRCSKGLRSGDVSIRYISCKYGEEAE